MLKRWQGTPYFRRYGRIIGVGFKTGDFVKEKGVGGATPQNDS